MYIGLMNTTDIRSDAQKALNLRVSKTAKTCNRYSKIWAAIHGCEGATRCWSYGVGSFGRQAVVYTCSACAAAEVAGQEAFKSGGRPAYDDHLEAARSRAGVVEYRNATYRVVDGRPVVTSPGWR